MLPLPRFSLEQPDSLADALALVAAGSRPIAGGTDLLPSMKHRIFEPASLVSLRGVRSLQEIALDRDLVVLGAGMTLREVQRHGLIRTHWRALADACATIATPTIQAMGTIGGNVALDTRCTFYNQPAGWRSAIGGCLKCDGTVCHVAPKGSGCYAAHSADTIPVLWLYDAVVQLVSSEGSRDVRVRELYGEDGRTGIALRHGEIIASVSLPVPAGPTVHRKLRTRGSIDYALLLVAVSRDDDGFHAVISAVGPRPIAVHAPSAPELADAAYAAVQPLATHLTPATWRKRMVRVEVNRACADLPG